MIIADDNGVIGPTYFLIFFNKSPIKTVRIHQTANYEGARGES